MAASAPSITNHAPGPNHRSPNRQRSFPIDSTRPHAASSLGGFPTRAGSRPSPASRHGPHRKTFTQAAVRGEVWFALRIPKAVIHARRGMSPTRRPEFRMVSLDLAVRSPDSAPWLRGLRQSEIESCSPFTQIGVPVSVRPRAVDSAHVETLYQPGDYGDFGVAVDRLGISVGVATRMRPWSRSGTWFSRSSAAKAIWSNGTRTVVIGVPRRLTMGMSL